MAGRPPKPTALKLLQGTLRRDRVGGQGDEPVSPGGVECPAHIKGIARALWDEWAPVYEAMGCLRKAHVLTFAAWMQAEAEIMVLLKAGTPVSVNLRKLALNYAVQFAGTPSASARVHVEPQKPAGTLAKYVNAQG